MSFLDTIRTKASTSLASLFDKNNAQPREPRPSRDELFRKEFRLPNDEIIIDESAAEISMSTPYGKKLIRNRSKSIQAQFQPPSPQSPVDSNAIANESEFYTGRLFLSPAFLIFRDTFDRNTFVFTLALATIKRVERLPSKSYVFALSITTYHGQNFIIQLIGIRSQSEKFSHNLRNALKANVPHMKALKQFLNTLYSEYLLTESAVSDEARSEHQKRTAPPSGGLGQNFRYPGDARKLRDKSKMRLWFDFFRTNGRNLTIVKQPLFYKLIRVGLPNRLRGEIWELSCGSIYLRMQNQREYEEILEANKGKRSLAIDEIEKDLNRSLPEYPAYQSDEGIDRLRRVLTAYSWKNPDVGYCQAMNIVMAALLIYMSEEQAFWCLSVLCDRMVPGYYSNTMYGTLLDQKVFEALVEKTMPVLWENMVKADIQLSVVSLPWFLSFFISTMPMVFAFRIVDVFFLNGPKALFQVALAILKVNGEALLGAIDDGMFIGILKDYFATLDHSAHPDSRNEKYRSITKFQELLVVAFKEFSVVTDDMINQERSNHKHSVLEGIESFVKRTQIRNLPRTPNITPNDLSNIYDRFYSAIQSDRLGLGSSINNSRMDFDSFRIFLSGIADWAKLPEDKNNKRNGKTRSDSNHSKSKSPIRGLDPLPKEHFLYRLFSRWDTELQGSLTLSNVAEGLNNMVGNDLMASMSNFFELYDEEGTEKVDREGILKMSEDLLYLTSPWRECEELDILTQKEIEKAVAKKLLEYEKKQQEAIDFDDPDIVIPDMIDVDRTPFEHQQQERYLSSVSSFIQRAFEYAIPAELPADFDPLMNNAQINNASKPLSMSANAALDPNHPRYITLATFRMVFLADETLELFFSETFPNSIHVDRSIDYNKTRPTTLRDVFDGIISDGKRVANEVKRRMDEFDMAARASEDNRSIRSRAKSNVSEDEDEEDDYGPGSLGDRDRDLLNDTEVVDVLNPSASTPDNERERIEFQRQKELSRSSVADLGGLGIGFASLNLGKGEQGNPKTSPLVEFEN